MTSLKRRLAGASANACGERKGQQIRAWLALSFTVGLLVVVYVSLSLSVSADPLLMPLDDTYIHFQYAQQFARGEPMVYNPGDGATSGGTSLLYPPLLAFGYRLGFDGWDLSYWALAVGSLSFLGATWLVYQIGLANPLEGETEGISSKTSPYALAMAWAFAVSGPFVWASFSGMETAWFVLVVLLLFWSVQRVRPGWAVVAGLLTTLTRPEGVALSALGMLVLALRISWQGDWRMRSRRAIMLAFPVFAAGVQPLINLLATGDTASSGMQAKSILYNTGSPFSSRLVMILEFYARIWRELLSGYSPDYGTFTSPLLANVALAGLLLGVWLAWRNKRVNVAVLALVWVVVLTAGVLNAGYGILAV